MGNPALWRIGKHGLQGKLIALLYPMGILPKLTLSRDLARMEIHAGIPPAVGAVSAFRLWQERKIYV